MSPRVDRYGEPLEDDEAQPTPHLWDQDAGSGTALPVRRCLLCSADLVAYNLGEVCAECRLIVANLFREPIEEKWRDLDDGEHVVSERGRIARLLNVDRSHRYPRVSIGGEKRYMHHLVAEVFHGPRPDGLLALHADDDPENPSAENLSWGSAKQNYEDAVRNGRIKTSTGTGPVGKKGTEQWQTS